MRIGQQLLHADFRSSDMLVVELEHHHQSLALKVNSSFPQHSTYLPAAHFIAAEDMLAVVVTAKKQSTSTRMFGFCDSVGGLEKTFVTSV